MKIPLWSIAFPGSGHLLLSKYFRGNSPYPEFSIGSLEINYLD